MADIQGKILNKYGIDITQENIFKLYKITDANISSPDLEQKILEARKRWNTSINGANEKNAKRDQARLDKADQYEAILKDVKLRKEVYKFYNKSSDTSGSVGSSVDTSSMTFAKEYFQLLATSKSIRKADVDFFFDCYSAERKHKKSILEMLKKELKIRGLGKEENYADENEATEATQGKRKDNSSPIIVNLFQKSTVLEIQRAVNKFQQAASDETLCQKYPKLREGLYAFLEIEDIENAQQYAAIMAKKSSEVYAVRQERGEAFLPLVDVFNILKNIEDYQDVVDNIPEFKLLLKYPKLTPYMYAFLEMKPATLKGMVKIAKEEYAFRDETDFLLNYYIPVHDNFGITDSGISGLIRKAQKKTKQNEILNQLDEKLGRNKKREIPYSVDIIHWLVYWPIFAVYLVYEVAKAIFTELHKFVIPAFVVVFLGENCIFPYLGIDNLLVLGKIFHRDQWFPYIEQLSHYPNAPAGGHFIFSIWAILLLLSVYVLPALFVSVFILKFADFINKQFDWIGIERTFQYVFTQLKEKTRQQYNSRKKFFFKDKAPKVISNFVCVGILLLLLHVIPIGMAKISEATGYGQAYTADEVVDSNADKILVITEEAANIRSGPDKGCDVLTVANQGNTFVATGNEQTDSDGSIWKEIYLDDTRTQTGWASEQVIAEQ